MRARADRRLVLGGVAGGIIFDIAARNGLATISGTAWVSVAVAAIALGGRSRGATSRLCLAAAPVLGLILTFRSSPWVIAPTILAAAILLFLGVSLGADGSGLSTTFPAIEARIAVVMGHIALAPGMFRSQGAAASGGAVLKRVTAVGRGALLAVPVMVVVGSLLALADPVFRSWFDLAAILQHTALVCVGAWAVMGLSRAASAARPSPSLPSSPSLGFVEAACVLGGLCALYVAFVVAQFVALSEGGHHVLATHGLTYAQYARSGFFQLLACAAITLLVLLGVRACANTGHLVLMGLHGLTVALTIGVVIVAIRRLQLYEAAFGLTMLRLACLVVAAWIGIVFLLLGSTIPRRGLPLRRFPAAVVVSGLVIVALWSTSNPASIVAQTNLRRAEHGRHLDVSQVVSLGPDAMPTLATGLRYLNTAQATELRLAICARSRGKEAGTAFNLSVASANEALTRACGAPG